MSAKHFGARLRELRIAAGLTRKELAEKAGLKSEAGVRNLEQGARHPLWKTVVALAAALGVGTEAFQLPPGDAPAAKVGRPRKPKPTDGAE